MSSPSMKSPNMLSPANGIITGSPIPRLSTPPGPPVFNTPVKPAAVPFRTSPTTPQPMAYSSATASSLPVSTPSFYSNGSSVGSQRDLPDAVRMEEPIAADSPYVLFSANKVLKQKKLANVASLGFGAIVSAGREISPGPQIIQRDSHRCLNCGAYSNPYSSILIGSGQWSVSYANKIYI
ncbi:PREDICTED: uncharacterized protein LOC109129535 [Camelina sativa]|uniref:Uncharacterized protein LOC109129535 n=1 Tax=Camelina sativa TaxID=90675 RepID=A0ABM1R2X2_CAMSA|nr:PREDICTED: uncharacterized protein LOC109129535 [Camelina sativa]